MKTKLYLSIAAGVLGMIGCRPVNSAGSGVNANEMLRGQVIYHIKDGSWAFTKKTDINVERPKNGIQLYGATINSKDGEPERCSKPGTEVGTFVGTAFAKCYLINGKFEYWILVSNVEKKGETISAPDNRNNGAF